MADNNFRSDRGRDLIEELARRIVQAHPDVESAPAESGCRGETAWDSYEVPPELPLASRLQVYGDAPEQTSELDEHHDDGSYDVDDQPCADDEHQDDATRVRRPKLVVAMAMFSLALAGTVGAFGHRATISGAGLPRRFPLITSLLSRSPRLPCSPRGLLAALYLGRYCRTIILASSESVDPSCSHQRPNMMRQRSSLLYAPFE